MFVAKTYGMLSYVLYHFALPSCMCMFVSLLLDVSQEIVNYIYLAPYAYLFYADFFCDFGRRTDRATSGLNDCGIRQSMYGRQWEILSGYNTDFGNDVNSDEQLGN